MASISDPATPADRRLPYRPVVAEAREEGYSAEEVNALLFEAEQLFETALRETELRLARAATEVDRSRTELAELTMLAEARRDALDAAEARSAHLEAVAASMLQSTSWRLTAPLRAVAGLLRR